MMNVTDRVESNDMLAMLIDIRDTARSCRHGIHITPNLYRELCILVRDVVAREQEVGQ